jgi:hypothetical protein
MLQKEKYPNIDSSINVVITFALFSVEKHKILFSYIRIVILYYYSSGSTFFKNIYIINCIKYIVYVYQMFI